MTFLPIHQSTSPFLGASFLSRLQLPCIFFPISILFPLSRIPTTAKPCFPYHAHHYQITLIISPSMAEEHHLPPEDHYHSPPRTTPEKPIGHKRRANPLRALCAFLSIFLLLAGVTILTLWLVYRPQKPRFTVVSAAIYDLNTTSPPFISTSMQFTLVTRNPNRRVSIYYDKLRIYVSYKNQMITPPLPLPPLKHKMKTTVAFSPVMGGPGVPVSAEVVNGLTMDAAYGVVGLRVVIVGKLRWKALVIKTGRYGVYVKCDVWVSLRKGVVGQVPLLGTPLCHVDV